MGKERTQNLDNKMNWLNPEEKISKYFSVSEALYLPSWCVYHTPTETEKENILIMADKMDKARQYIDMPIIVLCWIRPTSVNCPESEYHGKDYNARIGGASKSMHILGSAVDWYSLKDCDELRMGLKFKLNEFGLRMEDLKGSNWIHCDNKEILNGGQRYFTV